MQNLAKLSKQQLIELIQAQNTPFLNSAAHDPTIFETPTFPDTPDDIPGETKVEPPTPTNPTPQLFIFEVRINGKLKHTIINQDRDTANSRAQYLAKRAAITGWPSDVRNVTPANKPQTTESAAKPF